MDQPDGVSRRVPTGTLGTPDQLGPRLGIVAGDPFPQRPAQPVAQSGDGIEHVTSLCGGADRAAVVGHVEPDKGWEPCQVAELVEKSGWTGPGFGRFRREGRAGGPWHPSRSGGGRAEAGRTYV